MSASLEIVKLNEELVRKNIQISDQGKRMSEIKAENGMLHLQITELEKERNALKFANTEAKEYIESELGFRFITVCPSKPFNPREHQAIRDLEQMAKGIETLLTEGATIEQYSMNGRYRREADKLRNQAKALRDK